MRNKTTKNEIAQLIRKAEQSTSTYRIGAIAFDRRGKYLGRSCNKTCNKFDVHGKSRSFHAEMILMNRYGNRIGTIVICRIGGSGDLLPIDPCPVCLSKAEKLGITITTIQRKK